MTQNSAPHSVLSSRYVSAVLDAASEKGALTTLMADARDLIAMIDGSVDLSRLLASPLFSVADQTRALMAVMDASRFNDVTKGLVRLVVKNRRANILRDILVATLAEIAKRDGLMTADVDVATPLNDAAAQKLAAMLSQWSGARVSLNVRVTPDVLGGIKIRLGSMQIDDTVAGKLDRLYKTLKIAG